MDIKRLLDDFFLGECVNAYEYFGAHRQGNGVVFRVYAPHAYKIAVEERYRFFSFGDAMLIE